MRDRLQKSRLALRQASDNPSAIRLGTGAYASLLLIGLGGCCFQSS